MIDIGNDIKGKYSFSRISEFQDQDGNYAEVRNSIQINNICKYFMKYNIIHTNVESKFIP